MLFAKKTRAFRYSIPDLSITQAKISIKSKDFKTIYDLKKEIASQLNISEDELHFESFPSKKLRKIEDNYHFKLIFHSSHPDINIIIPSGEKILIKDCYKNKYEDIFPFLEREGNYFTQTLIQNNTQLFYNRKEIEKTGFPFLSSKQNSIYELKIVGKTISLKYGDFSFTVLENEKTTDVINLVQKAYPNLNIYILDSSGNKPEIIKEDDEYRIRVEKIVKFTNIYKPDSIEFISVDYFETVFDVRELLAMKIGGEENENIVICDFDRNEIPNSEKPLRDYQNLNTDFYFKIRSKSEKSIRPNKAIEKIDSNKEIEKTEPEEKNELIKPIKKTESTDSTHDTDDAYSSYSYNSDSDSSKYNKMRSFFYSIPELSISSKIIRVNIDECQTIYDLKKKIAADHRIPDEILFFNTKHKQVELKKTAVYTNFELKIRHPSPDIVISLTNEISVTIKNGYKMKYEEIFQFTEKVGFYFSQKCIANDITLFFEKKEISSEGFPFLISKKGTCFELKVKSSIVMVKYDKVRFIFSNRENVSEAKRLVGKVFPDSVIKIRNSSGSTTFTLRSEEKYRIRVEKSVKFIDIDNDSVESIINLDKFDTILYAKESLIDEQLPLLPLNNLILYDSNKNKISDQEKKICAIQDISKCFYYKVNIEKRPESAPTSPKLSPGNRKVRPPVSIFTPVISEVEDEEECLKIIFFFFVKNEKPFDSMKSFISVEKTVAEIATLIAEERNIHGKIIIGYKCGDKFKPLAPNLRIEQVRKLIKPDCHKGKNEFEMYVQVLKPSETKATAGPKKYIKESPEKTENPSKKDDDDNDDCNSYNAKKGNNNKTDKRQKKRPSKIIFKPTVVPVDSDPIIQTTSVYKLEYEEHVKQIELRDQSTLGSEEERIKEEFDILPNEKLIYKYINDKNGEEITDVIDKKMRFFKKGTIHVDTLMSNSFLFIDVEQVEDLKKTKEIKKDDFGIIYEVYSKTDNSKKYALKIMNRITLSNLKHFVKEHEMLKELDHPYILKTTGICMGTDDHPPAIVFEHFILTLDKFMRNYKLSKIDAFRLILIIAEGMKYVHFSRIIHRNLNPKNIFLTRDKKVKIGEFGLSKLISLNEQLTFSIDSALDDIIFVAPELRDAKKYNSKVDVYSFGVLVIFILNNGILPKNGKKFDYELKIPSTFSKFTTDLIERCLSHDCKIRPSFEEICNEIKENYNKIMPLTKAEEDSIRNIIKRSNDKIPNY
ncbi:hypothetical protein M9Y10_010243 [Tritrichomonas musculus]|uniref:Protein kinase domain-containing protein n=1 Tax=Tritrichomonas musculus TaxID=1915356 RepID=A0ABR2IQQ2_9EUKA